MASHDNPSFVRNVSAWNRAQIAAMVQLDREPMPPEDERKMFLALMTHLEQGGRKPSTQAIAELSGANLRYVRMVRRKILVQVGYDRQDHYAPIDWSDVSLEQRSKASKIAELMADQVGLKDLHPTDPSKKTIAAIEAGEMEAAVEEDLRAKILGIKSDAELEQVLSDLASNASESVRVQAVKTLNDLRNRRRPQEQARLKAPLDNAEAIVRAVTLIESLPKEVRLRVLYHFKGLDLSSVAVELLDA